MRKYTIITFLIPSSSATGMVTCGPAPPKPNNVNSVGSNPLSEVSSGGGTVIWKDKTGALNIGPMSAGSEPGPLKIKIIKLRPVLPSYLYYILKTLCGKKCSFWQFKAILPQQ